VAVPRVRVADPRFNAGETLGLLHRAAGDRAVIALFPELGLSAYSCEDLFGQRALLDASVEALARVVEESAGWPIVGVVGAPIRVEHLLYNCAVVFTGGRLLGVVPKTFLPNYREYYEARQFAPGATAARDSVDLCGQRGVPFGADLLFRWQEQPGLTMHAEVCEDLWVPIPPSSHAALAGATLLLNLSASNVTIAKADYRHLLVASQSARCVAGYLYSAAGPGESTTDLAWDGHALVYENGTLLAESRRFERGPQLITAEIDLDRLGQERMRQTSFGQATLEQRERARRFRTMTFSLAPPGEPRLLPRRTWDRCPYVPADPEELDQRCGEVYEIQVQGLATRLEATGIPRVVIGVSGGLDSTQALLVCAQAMDQLGRPRDHVLGCTMPGFATTPRTLEQARRLMRALGCEALEIDIRPSALQMLADIGHPAARGEPCYDVTFENVQAGERTSHLFRLANFRQGLVVGTSDLSELALGWCTYGVGDHMAHYHVNASVPKTLVRHVIRWVAERERFDADASAVLRDILATRISPELVPGGAGAQPAQETEAVLGPFELQDFNLYYTLRFGYAPAKVAFLAWLAWREKYGIGEIKRVLGIFLRRFFGESQFKRSCIANAPKVGSGGSLSPRGDWRAPSDGRAAAWLASLADVPDTEDPPPPP
jgi:NAD+ synthase (glutamine-hydrolysing)